MKFLRVLNTLGSVFRVYALFLLVPLLGSLYWDTDVAPSSLSQSLGVPLKSTTISFLLTLIFVLFLGILLSSLAPRMDEALRDREAFFLVGAGWFFCALLGALPFLLTQATQNPIVALFESMSGITTTGFSALALPLERYPESVHLWRATLHLFGGIGIVLIVVAVVGQLTTGGYRIVGSESGAGGGDVARLRPRLSQTARSLFFIYLTLNVLFFLLLLGGFHFGRPRFDWKTSVFEAYVHSVGAVATGGFSSHTDSVATFGSTLINVLVMLAILAGGINFALYYQLTHGRQWRDVWRNAELRFAAGILLAAGLVVSGFALFQGSRSLPWSLGHGFFAATSTMLTCGYSTVSLDRFPDGAKLVFLLLMVTGGMVGSTAGAIKTGRILLLFRLTYRELEKLLHPHAVSVVKAGGHIFPQETIRRVVVFFFSYVTVFIAGAIAFALLGFDLSSSLVSSAASLGGVGLGWGDVAAGFMDPASDAARLVGIALMWLGRLEIFTVLLLFAPGTYRD